MKLSGPTGHSNPLGALVLVAVYSPGCLLVLFMPVFYLCDDFSHLFCVCGPSFSCTAPGMLPSIGVDLTLDVLSTGWPQGLSAGPKSCCVSALSSKENFYGVASWVPRLRQLAQQHFLLQPPWFGRMSSCRPWDLERWLPSLADLPA